MSTTSPNRVFSKWDNESYPFRFEARLELGRLVGGIPSDPKVAEGWLRSKLQESDDRIREMVAQVMIERSIGIEEATEHVNNLKNLNGFKRTPDGVLFIEGRQLKAAIKEAVSIAVAAKKLEMTGWGATRKWLSNFLPEHVFILEETMQLNQWSVALEGEKRELEPVKKPSGIMQQFVHTHRGSSIQYQEYVDDAVIEFHLISDYPFTSRDWGMIWTTGEKNGLGASRSQGYGTYGVTKWDATGSKEVVASPEVVAKKTAAKKAA